MQSHIIIPLEDFPEGAQRFCGEVDSSILALATSGMRPSGPISYDFEAQLFENELVLRGSAAAPFVMRCDRCLAEFDYTVRVDNIAIAVDVEELAEADITDDVREELILALPGYPKCELSGKECQNHDIIDDFRLDKSPSPGVNSATPSGESVWNALDKLPGSQRP